MKSIDESLVDQYRNAISVSRFRFKSEVFHLPHGLGFCFPCCWDGNQTTSHCQEFCPNCERTNARPSTWTSVHFAERNEPNGRRVVLALNHGQTRRLLQSVQPMEVLPGHPLFLAVSKGCSGLERIVATVGTFNPSSLEKEAKDNAILDEVSKRFFAGKLESIANVVDFRDQ